MARVGWRWMALSGAVVGVLASSTLSPAFADYPTWDDIEAARQSEAATESTIAQLSGLLDELQAESARLGDEAVARAAEADAARVALERAERSARSLQQRADAAAETAAQSATLAASLAAALYRSGGGELTSALLVAEGSAADDLLYRLGAIDRVGEQVGEALEQAERDANAAAALLDQARVAEDERRRLSETAQQASAAADSAAAAADAAVADQQSRLTVLYEQLASLKNTTVYLEQQYRIGLEGNGGGGSGGSGGGGGSGAGGFEVPGNEVNNVAAAQYFAMVQLASMGFGSDQGNCLIWLWNRESGWRTNAYNASSGAYGIPQALPGSKMANYAADWRTNYQTQIMWGLIYIQGRYGSPCAAWAHSEAVGWY